MFDLGYDVATLEEAQGAWTAREIAQQPACLRETAATLSANAYALPLLSDPAARVVLTGTAPSRRAVISRRRPKPDASAGAVASPV